MQVTLTVIEGPHRGRVFTFSDHDTFLVGRSKYAHFQLLAKDRFFSRIHFLMELSPPQCRLVDMNSRNGTYVNGQRVTALDLQDGDQIKAGHTVLAISVQGKAVVATATEEGPGQAVAGFQMVRELGRGGLGVLHLARRLADEQLLALKTITPASAVGPGTLENFLYEARTLSQLDHPVLVKLHDVLAADGKIVALSDYVAAPDAQQIVAKRGPLSVRETVQVALQLLDGLEYAHAREQVHYEIKPSNVLIREEEGQVRAFLTDFGLARVYQASRLSGLSVTGAVAGGGAFLPPERITRFRQVLPTSDQYGLAATMYFLLTGHGVQELPDGLARQLTQIMRSGPVPIQKHRADLPIPLVGVIHRALARDPARRFADVKDMRRALMQVDCA